MYFYDKSKNIFSIHKINGNFFQENPDFIFFNWVLIFKTFRKEKLIHLYQTSIVQ